MDGFTVGIIWLLGLLVFVVGVLFGTLLGASQTEKNIAIQCYTDHKTTLNDVQYSCSLSPAIK